MDCECKSGLNLFLLSAGLLLIISGNTLRSSPNGADRNLNTTKDALCFNYIPAISPYSLDFSLTCRDSDERAPPEHINANVVLIGFSLIQ
jgi:hypothetical protein